MPPENTATDDNPNTVLQKSDPMRQKFLDILSKNGITKEVEEIFMKEPEELKGEHFAATTVYLKVSFKDGTEKNLFVKMFANMASAQWAKDMKVMDKEAEFFIKFLPKLKEFCGNYKGCENLLNFFPKCYHGDEEMVVLDNLVLNEGYVMLDKAIKQDLYTAKFVLERLAKFHAANYAFILEEGGIEKFREDEKWGLVCHEALLPENSPMMEGMYDGTIGTCINILKVYSTEGSEKAIKILESNIGHSYSIIQSALKFNPEKRLQVVNHGDFHNNNMLFRKSNEKVTDMMFVDLQITRFGSPTTDIGYYFYTSVHPEIRRAHLEELLRHYFATFKETLKQFGKPCPISFEQFYDDYKICSDLGYFMGLNVLTAIGAMKEIDMETLSKDPDEMQKQWKAAIDGWISRNPEKSKAIAQELVAVANEREVLQGRK